MQKGQKVKVISGELKGRTGRIKTQLLVTGFYVVDFGKGEQYVFPPNEIESCKNRSTLCLHMI